MAVAAEITVAVDMILTVDKTVAAEITITPRLTVIAEQLELHRSNGIGASECAAYISATRYSTSRINIRLTLELEC
jgi:hypothetical protein